MTEGEGTDIASSDLFFSLAAILIVLLCILSQSLRDRVTADRSEARLAEAASRTGLWMAIAGKDAVVLSRPDGTRRSIPLQDILSPATEDWARAAPAPLRVVVTAEAADSAFLLETALARAGVAMVERFRLSGPCNAPVFRRTACPAMADDMETAAQGAIVADLGANLVAILVMLLAVVSLSQSLGAGAGPITRPQSAAPLSGQAQSDLLYLRLNPRPDTLVVELTEGGAFVPQGTALLPLAEVPRPWPTRIAAFVFSPRHHAAFRELAEAEGRDVVELTVPTALRAGQTIAGQSGFSRAFLEIRAGRDPASIRPALLRLLTAGPGGSALGGEQTAETATASLPSRLLGSAHLLMNTLLLLASILLLRALRRRFH